MTSPPRTTPLLRPLFLIFRVVLKEGLHCTQFCEWTPAKDQPSFETTFPSSLGWSLKRGCTVLSSVNKPPPRMTPLLRTLFLIFRMVFKEGLHCTQFSSVPWRFGSWGGGGVDKTAEILFWSFFAGDHGGQFWHRQALYLRNWTENTQQFNCLC